MSENINDDEFDYRDHDESQGANLTSMSRYRHDKSLREQLEEYEAAFLRTERESPLPALTKQESNRLERITEEQREAWRAMSFEEKERHVMEIEEKFKEELAEWRQHLAEKGVEDPTKQWWRDDDKELGYERQEYELDDRFDKEDYWQERDYDEDLLELSEEDESRDQFSQETFDESWRPSESNHVIYLKTKDAHRKDDIER